MHRSPLRKNPGHSADVSLVVHGRFHAFSLAKALTRSGLRVHVLTNYPETLAKRWLGDQVSLQCHPLHGLLQRVVNRLDLGQRFPALGQRLHSSFSRWAALRLRQKSSPVVHCFSGVALEMIEECQLWADPPQILLARGSSHIVEQHDILEREQQRCGVAVEKPSSWMIQRELQEYALSDKIIVLSEFARDSFIRQQVDPSKLSLLPLGCDLRDFKPVPGSVDERLRRVQAGEPLNVLGTGTFCMRKGALDFVAVARALTPALQFTWVGGVASDAARLAAHSRDVIRFIPRVSEFALPAYYRNADLYFFPTLEDGFAVTLSQAAAGALPIVATDRCAAPELLRQGGGWVVQACDQMGMISRLRAIDRDRSLLAAQIRFLSGQAPLRDWDMVARDFVRVYEGMISH